MPVCSPGVRDRLDPLVEEQAVPGLRRSSGAAGACSTSDSLPERSSFPRRRQRDPGRARLVRQLRDAPCGRRGARSPRPGYAASASGRAVRVRASPAVSQRSTACGHRRACAGPYAIACASSAPGATRGKAESNQQPEVAAEDGPGLCRGSADACEAASARRRCRPARSRAWSTAAARHAAFLRAGDEGGKAALMPNSAAARICGSKLGRLRRSGRCRGRVTGTASIAAARSSAPGASAVAAA